jgi:hypothetical protein
MKALFATAAVLVLASTAQARHALIATCANNEYDVTVSLDTETVAKLGKDVVIVSINDISGHGKDYTAVLPKGAWPSKLGAGLEARSTEDNGKITLMQSGKIAIVTGEFALKTQCIDYTSDNPSGQ